jgi:hypothetical protein
MNLCKQAINRQPDGRGFAIIIVAQEEGKKNSVTACGCYDDLALGFAAAADLIIGAREYMRKKLENFPAAHQQAVIQSLAAYLEEESVNIADAKDSSP